MKIVIMGYSGSGKSTLAKRLNEIYESDILHIDMIQFLPNWDVRQETEKERIMEDFLDTHDSWIIDGNYSRLSYERRLQEADLIILLLFNRFSCLYRAYHRYFTYRGKNRPDMAEGCSEKIDTEFVWWILHEGRNKEKKDRYRKIMETYPDKTVVLRNQKQLNAYLEKMK